jgi:hypothetical protein
MSTSASEVSEASRATPVTTTGPDESGPRLTRLGRTLEKYAKGELVSWDDAKARILGAK